MRSVSVKRPQLAPIFRSETQLQILAVIYLEPGQHFALADVVARLSRPQPTVAREVARLVEAGLLESELVRGRRSVWAATESPIFAELESLLLKTVGPKPIIEGELAGLAGSWRALIYGSWARRFAGQGGPVPNDIDLLIVGAVDVRDARERADRASARLHRDVNITVLSQVEWDEQKSGFVRELREAPRIELTVQAGA